MKHTPKTCQLCIAFKKRVKSFKTIEKLNKGLCELQKAHAFIKMCPPLSTKKAP